MHLLYVLERYPELSQTFVTREIQHVLGRGHHVKVCHIDEPLVAADEAPVPGVRLPANQWSVLRLSRAIAPYLARRPLAVLWCLAHLLRRGSLPRLRVLTQALDVADQARTADRLHAHFAGRAATIAMLAGRLAGRPWSFTSHAIDIFVRDEDVELKLRTAAPPITVCQYNVDFLADRFGFTGKQPIVPCGVDVPESVDGEPEPGLVVVVARLVEKKGLDLLLQSLARPEAAAVRRCVIIGDGPQEEELTRLATTLGLLGGGAGDRVQFLGAQQSEVVDEWMRRAWALALPARIAADGDRDSQPVVIKEAMARGVPVVATDVVAIGDMVDDTTGLLVPPEDVDALARALGQAMAWSDEERAALGTAGRARVVSEFAFDVTIDRLLEAWTT